MTHHVVYHPRATQLRQQGLSQLVPVFAGGEVSSSCFKTHTLITGRAWDSSPCCPASSTFRTMPSCPFAIPQEEVWKPPESTALP